MEKIVGFPSRLRMNYHKKSFLQRVEVVGLELECLDHLVDLVVVVIIHRREGVQ